MKTITKFSLAAIAIMFALQIANAQNYKAPKIDASGKITDKDGKAMGTISKDGIITDNMGMKVAHIDAEGSLVDEKTGMKMGKAQKNGNFIAHYTDAPDQEWTISAPMNGTCLIKDKDGKIKAEVHENYKAFGACAIHCMEHKMNHGDVMDEKKMEATADYACPMHPEVTSDKPGKCSKCGMALVKKKK